MNYHNITHDDMLNGTGLRVVLWVAGCSHKCEGCQNPVTWDEYGGIPFDKAAEEELFKYLSKPYIEGITFSGGDPLFENNRFEILRLVKEITEKFPDKNIWVYTGYEWESVRNSEIMNYVDVLVDGKFVKALADNELHWRGSSNQRVIDVKESLKLKKTVLFE